jgi:rSAM/selenodomain-associated transferase 2
MGSFTLGMLAQRRACPLLASRAVLSMIVPVRGEEPSIAARFERFARDPGAELIVADGGGADGSATATAFRAVGARVLPGSGTRGARLAEAARQARGDTLFFIHSDSSPPDGALDAVRRAISRGAVGGAFSLAYEDAGPALTWIAAWANLRSRWLGLPFGDQGIFCRRDVYERAGGFRDLPICDDLDFVRRLRRCGQFVILDEKTTTSPRRYRERGEITQVLVNWKVQLGYFAGVDPRKLERWYNGRT